MPHTPKQIRIIGECLHAAAHGPFFPDGEFDTLFGLSREQVAEVAAEWPVVIDAHEILTRAVNNSMNMLLGYPTKNKAEHWEEYISVERKELVEIYAAWRKLPTTDNLRGTFDRFM